MRRNVLYGPRIEGDLDIGLQVTRVGSGVKDWARINGPGGRLPGQSEQEIGEQSETQKYRIGTRRVQDERVFRYCKASTTGINRAYLAAQDMNRYKVDGSQEHWQGTLSATAEAGAYTVVTADTTAAHILDFFAGGWVYLRPASANQQLYRIRSNTAAGTSMTLTLWEPLKFEAASGGTIWVIPSIYSNLQRVHGGGDTKAGFPCVPIRTVTASYYFWGQTWGPCMGTPSQGDMAGSYERDLVFSYDGSIRNTPAKGANSYFQKAGHSLLYQTDAQTNGLCFFMLQISP